MKKINSTGRRKSRLNWHPAFIQAMQLELQDYRDSLEFKCEYQLNAEPFRIDLLIVIKPKDLKIDKNIARIFRSNNIIEYKSPEDYFSINDFLKVYAYANIYAAITLEVEFSDITLTFIENRYPRKLINYLKKVRKYQVKETNPGIYNVTGDYLPIQIIISNKLSDNDNLWLKSLKNDLEINNAGDILEAGERQAEKTAINAYMDVLIRANPEIFMEAQNMAVKTQTRTRKKTFEEVFTEAGLIPKWKAEGFAEGEIKGETKGKLIVARNLLAMEMPISKIAKAVQLPVKDIKALAVS